MTTMMLRKLGPSKPMTAMASRMKGKASLDVGQGIREVVDLAAK